MVNILSNLQSLLNKSLMYFKLPINNKIYKLIIIKTKLNIYGDYQINGLYNYCKNINISIYKLYKKIIFFLLRFKLIFKKIILNNNFINIFLKNNWINKKLNQLLLELIEPQKKYILNNKNYKKTIIIDYSSPNIAKEMHIGHLRSTIIGDVISNIYIYLKYKIIKINHIGDWGKQFGLLISYLKINNIINTYNNNTLLYKEINFKKINDYYKLAQIEYKNNIKFSKLVHYYTFLLQNKNIFNNIWKKIIKLSIINIQKIYKILNISLKIKNIYGESFYKPYLNNIINDLLKKKIVLINQGAVISKFKINNINKYNILILKKYNGCYLYSSTDLCAIKYRYDHFNPKKILYFIDSRQKIYIKHVILLAKKANYIPLKFPIKHLSLGMILNKNNIPFKSREGNYISLYKFIKLSKNLTNKLFYKKLLYKNIPIYKIHYIINAIAIGSLKYYELSKKRTINYIFNINNAISYNGNTSLYIQYAYIRIISILNKVKNIHINYKKQFYNVKLNKFNKYEKNLILHILKFDEILKLVIKYHYPHLICEYLYILSKFFNNIYENSSILYNKILLKKIFYIKIIFITYRILKIGLKLLGISIINKL